MKKLLRDRVVRTTLYLILLMWGFSTCSAVTGVWFDRRWNVHHLSPAEIRDVWYLPILMTIVWTPIIVWRAFAIRRERITPPAAGPMNIKDQGPATASSGVYIFASLLLFLGIALACNFSGDPQRWRVGVAILAVCTLPFVFIIFRRIRLRRALGPAELYLDARIQRGFSGTARYVRPLRGAELKSVDVRLSCEEKHTKKFNRIWIPTTRVLHEETITAQVTPSADRIDIRIPLHIPPTGSRSMTTDNTTIIWWLRLRLQMSGCPDTKSAFAIEVA
ncbi:MAG TPA: hypothetical protein VII32_11705 [Thermoanaerobaculia bacterium]|jgi:hypothetical protein